MSANMGDVPFVLSKENFICSICLDIFTSPTSLQCGHNFCKACIIENWRINRKRQCPLCKTVFHIKTEVHVNILVSDMAAQIKQSDENNSSEIAQARDVPCDICTGTKLKALKSCLVCLSSYCNTHLEKHRAVLHLKKHKLIDPLVNLEGRICPNHIELMELFCITDQQCVCTLCNELHHKSHDVVTLKEEFEKKKSELERKEAGIQGMIEERQLKVEELRKASQLSEEVACKLKADSMNALNTATLLLKKELTLLTKKVDMKHKTMTDHVEGLTKELENEINELMRRNCEIKKYTCSDDHLLLQNISLSSFPPTKNWGEVHFQQPLSDLLKGGMHQWYMEELEKIMHLTVDIILRPDTHPLLTLSNDG